MRTLLHVLLVAAALAILAYPTAVLLDKVYGQDVVLVSLNDAETQETNRQLFELTVDPGSLKPAELRAQVVAIYGVDPKPGETERVLVFDDARVIRPAELPDLALMQSGADANGDYPYQAQSARYLAGSVTLGGFVAAIVLLLVRARVMRHGAPAAA